MQCSGYREECDHFQDYYWSLESTLGDIPVESCEPHSSQVPLAWASAYVGEPATVSHTYTNYLKADRESLFVHKELEHFKVPELPEVYGYYRANPVLGDAAVPGEWQTALREINADLGASHQVDVKVLTTRVQDPTYAQAVEARWLYGPKNSVTIVLGIEGTKITWARVVTFSKVENLKVFLRDELQGKTFEDDVPLIIRRAVSQMFRRTAMSDYEYLARAAQPSTGWLVFLYVLGTAISVGIAVYMHKHDVFGEESLQFGYSYRQNHYRRK
jgi:hypothetical protein